MIDVLWFEDQLDENEGFQELAESLGIELHHFLLAVDAVDALEADVNRFDAIILDAKGLKKSLDTTADLKGLALLTATLNRISSKRVIPAFVFTGQPDLLSGDLFQEMMGNIPVYSKTSGEGQKLLLEVRSQVTDAPITQIKHKYRNILSACTDKYLGQDTHKDMVNALLEMDQIEYTSSTKDRFAFLRKTLEKCFESLFKCGLIPEEVVDGGLNSCSYFICGRHKYFELDPDIEIVDKVIQNIFPSLVKTVQDGCHASATLDLKVDQYISKYKSPHLYTACFHQTMEFMLWTKRYIDDNPDVEKNTEEWWPN